MAQIKNLLEQKGHDVWSINPENSVYEAIKLMDEKGVGALAVLHDSNLVGILSERDYARKIILKDRSSRETKVKEIMSSKVFHTVPEQDINECMAIMTQHHIRHLPVMQDDQLIGMISLGDVVKQIIAEQQFKIESLEHSISWGESY